MSKTAFKFEGLKKIPLPAMTLPWTRKNYVLLVEITDENLKLAGVLDEGKKRKWLWAVSDSVVDLNEIQISQKIHQILKATFFKPTKVVIVHPTKQLTTRVLSLPSVDDREIKDILDLQAVKQTPYTKDEITTGFRLIDRSGAGYSQVLLAISHRDISTRYCRILEIARLIPDQVTTSIEGLWAWFLQAKAKDAIAETDIILFLDIDWGSTDLMIFGGKKLLFNRNLGIGGKQLQDGGESAQSDFEREVERSVELGAPELKNMKVSHVVLGGIAGRFKDVAAVISRELNVPCEILPVFQSFPGQAPASIAQAGEPTDLGQVSWAGIAGLALDPQAGQMNLLPGEAKLRKNLQDRGKDLAMFGTLLMALIMMISGAVFTRFYKKTSYLNNLKKMYISIKGESEGIERTVAKMKIAQEQMSANGSFLDVFRDIQIVLPPTISLTSFEYQAKDKTVVIRGISEEMSTIFQFLSTLEATPYLEFVKTRNVSKRKVEEKELAEFEMIANIETKAANAAPPKGETRPAADSLKGEK